MKSLLTGAVLLLSANAIAGDAAPSPEDAFVLPEEIATAKLSSLLFDGEPIGRPGWPLIARYLMFNNAIRPRTDADIELRCRRSAETKVICNDKGAKRGSVDGVPVCYYPPDPDDFSWKGASTAWIDSGWDCFMFTKAPNYIASAKADEQKSALYRTGGVITFIRRVAGGKLTEQERTTHAMALARVHADTQRSWKRR